jgi:hypothetical protein
MSQSLGETSVFLRHLVLVILCGWLSAYQTVIHKYQVSHKRSCFSWSWAHSRPIHVEIDKCIKNKYSSSSSIGTTTVSWVSACPTIVEHSQHDGFTECCCQRRVKPRTSRRTKDLERSNFRHKRPPASEATLVNPAAEGGTMGEKRQREFCRKWRLPRHFWVLLHAVMLDMGQMALLPLRRKACWGFFRPKNPTASAGFEPANLGTKGQHTTSRPPKPLKNKYTKNKLCTKLVLFTRLKKNALSRYPVQPPVVLWPIISS